MTAWLWWRWQLARVRHRRRRFVQGIGLAGRPATEGDLLLFASLRAIERRLEQNRP